MSSPTLAERSDCRPDTDRFRPSGRDLSIAAALVLAVLAIYAQTYAFEFVNYDDQEYVYENANVRSGLTPTSIAWAFSTGHAANWHPLTWLSHQLDVTLFGPWAGGHHLVSVAIHAINAVLLFVLLRILTGRIWPCAITAALFAVHPLRAESVAWVAERKDVLSTCFGFLSLIAYVRHVRAGERFGRWYLAAFGALSLSLMSKPMFVTMPFVMLLLDVWPLRRVEPFDPSSAVRRLRLLLAEKSPFLALVAASALVTFLVQSEGGAVMAQSQLPLAARLANAIVGIVRYVRMTLAPYDLAPYYPHPYAEFGSGISPFVLVSATAGVFALTAFAIGQFRRRPYLTVGWFWFLGTLVPVIGVVQVSTQAVADRYTYVPGIGLTFAIIFCAADLAAKGPRWRHAMAVLALIAIVGYGTAGFRQASVWRNSISLMQQGADAVPESFVARNNLGAAYDAAGDLAAAEHEYARAAELAPSDPGSRTNLASVMIRTNQLEKAKRLIDYALQSNPEFAPAYLARADWHLARGEFDEAFADYERGIKLAPADRRSRHNYALALAQAGRLDAAKAQWRAALSLDPGYARALDGYGRALLATGEIAEAHAALRKAIAIDPSLHAAANALAWSLATTAEVAQRRPIEAAALARRAVSTVPRHPGYLDTLAAAYAAGGRFAEAARLAEQAADEADAAGQLSMAAAIRTRGSLYRQGRAFVSRPSEPSPRE